MNDYYKIRLQLYVDRKKHQLDILEYMLKIISNKVRFIMMVVEKKLDISNKKKVEIEELLTKNKFPMIGKNKYDNKVSYDYLLNMPMYSLSNEKIEELKENEKEKQEEYNVLNSKTPEMIWLEELEVLETKYIKWYKKHMEELSGEKKKKKAKK
jgi:DNA topoisomerase-2